MLKEALEYMAESGRKSASRVVKADAEPSHVYYLRKVDDTLERVTAEATPRQHVAADLQAIAEMASKHGGEVWFSRNGVVLLIGPGRRDRVTLPLDLSTPIRQLAHWEKQNAAMSQAQLVKILRITFRECLAPAGNIVEIIRRVKFGTNTTGESAVEHGKVSIGKSLNAEITGTGILPEFISLQVPVFSNPAFVSASYAVECALEPDPQTATFQVIPVPGRIEKAIVEGERRLGIMIGDAIKEAGADVPVYFGNA